MNLKFSKCDILETSMVVQPLFSGYGALAASRSASAVAVANKLDFKSKGDELFVSRDAQKRPTVKINYFLEGNTAPRTSFSCSVDPKFATGQTSFTLDKFLMGGVKMTSEEYDGLCGEYLDYLDALETGVSNMSFGQNSDRYLSKFGAMGQFKTNFMLNAKSTLLKPLNDYAVTKLVPGLNPITGLSTATTTAFKNAQGMIVTDFLEQIYQLKMKTGYQGRYIALSGYKNALWLSRECGLPAGIHCCSQLGINGGAVLDALNFMFYLDNTIDAVYGPGTIILIEEGAFAMKTFTDLLPDTSWDNEDYGTMNFNVALNCEENISIPLQTFSSEKGLCFNNGAGVSLNLYWMLKYDIWTRPFNFRDGSADTGIYHFVVQ